MRDKFAIENYLRCLFMGQVVKPPASRVCAGASERQRLADAMRPPRILPKISPRRALIPKRVGHPMWKFGLKPRMADLASRRPLLTETN